MGEGGGGGGGWSKLPKPGVFTAGGVGGGKLPRPVYLNPAPSCMNKDR